MKVTHYINQRNFKHWRGFRVQRKRDNAFNAGINTKMNLAEFIMLEGGNSLEIWWVSSVLLPLSASRSASFGLNFKLKFAISRCFFSAPELIQS